MAGKKKADSGTKKVSSVKTENKKESTFPLKALDVNIKYLALLSFIVIAFILYFQCLTFGYVLDDKIVITDNSFTKKGFAGLWDLFTTESFQGYFGEQKNLLEGGRYRPLSLMTFAIEHQFFGLNSALSHHVNVLLYGLCGFFSFITLRRLFKEKTYKTKVFISLSFLASVLFIVHPIHTEAVANIKGRDEILAFMFSMLSMFFALRFYDRQKLISLVWMILCFFLGLLAKENTITFLAIIPFGMLLFRSGNKKKIIQITGLLLGTVIGYLVLRYQVIGFLFNGTPSNDIMNNPFAGLNSVERLGTIFYTLMVYIRLNIFPHPLTHDYYPYHIPVLNFEDYRVWLSILFHLFLASGVFYFWKRKPKVSFAIGFYLAAMSIISNLVVNVGTFMNERFAFTASLGFCILAVYLLQRLNSKFPQLDKNLLKGSVIVIALLFSAKTWLRVPVWENALTLNRAAVSVSKNSARANSFMSTALFEEYKVTTDRQKQMELLNEAQPYMQKALSIYPNYYNGNLMRAGIAAEKYKLDGNLNNLLSEFIEVMKVRPDVDYLTEYLEYLNNRADTGRMGQFYTQAGKTILNQGVNVTWAVHYLLMGNKIDPQNQAIKSLLVQGYTMLGRPADAAKFK
ncbi:MAG: DUF1736 domain-containing protein [Bacteroidia bacterium]|nr:DUF1736 domain-containing protein [Bacteroidia bacterium]